MVRAMFQIPFRIIHLKFFINIGIEACYLWILMDSVGNIASILNVFLISVDRYYITLMYVYVQFERVHFIVTKISIESFVSEF